MNRSNTFDIAVVGAGPAGAMAAAHAGKGGRRVCLLERKQRPGVPVRCGEGVGLKGLTASIDVNPRWIQSTIRRACFVSPSGERVILARFDESYIIDRIIMENDLIQTASESGAAFFNATPVSAVVRESDTLYRCVTPRGDFFAQCVILADGVESRLARGLGWETALALEDMESCAFCRVSHESIENDTVYFYVGSVYAPGGFAWVFPRSHGCANVGVGILGEFSNGGEAKEYLNRLIGHIFPGGAVSELHCGGVPVGRWIRPLVREGVMLAGDAARQVNALSGAGLGYGMFAGRIAGETAARAVEGGRCNWKTLKEYEKIWRTHLGRQQLRSYALKRKLLTKNNDEFYDIIARSFAGENPEKLNYMRIFFRAFARHPLMLLKIYHLFR